jgi:outer membrane lipoprotein SlyB
MRSFIFSLCAAAALLCLASCAVTPGLGGADYERNQVRTEQSVRLATVINSRHVRIEGTKSGLGLASGTLAGATSVHRAGAGLGHTVAPIAGAVAGGLVGSAIEESVTSQPGVEVAVQFDDGKVSLITQAADEEFSVGDRVIVAKSAGVTRVTRMTQSVNVVPTAPPPIAPPVVSSSQYLCISPSVVRVSAVGYGSTSSQSDLTTGQKKLLGMRASKIDAYRSMAEQIAGLHLTSNTTVGDMMSKSDSIRTSVDAYIRGARVVEVSPMSDGNYQTMLEIDLDSRIFTTACTTQNAMLPITGPMIIGSAVPVQNNIVYGASVPYLGSGYPSTQVFYPSR